MLSPLGLLKSLTSGGRVLTADQGAQVAEAADQGTIRDAALVSLALHELPRKQVADDVYVQVQNRLREKIGADGPAGIESLLEAAADGRSSGKRTVQLREVDGIVEGVTWNGGTLPKAVLARVLRKVEALARQGVAFEGNAADELRGFALGSYGGQELPAGFRSSYVGGRLSLSYDNNSTSDIDIDRMTVVWSPDQWKTIHVTHGDQNQIVGGSRSMPRTMRLDLGEVEAGSIVEMAVLMGYNDGRGEPWINPGWGNNFVTTT